MFYTILLIVFIAFYVVTIQYSVVISSHCIKTSYQNHAFTLSPPFNASLFIPTSLKWVL